MKIPMIRTVQPNKGFNFFPSIFFEIPSPTKIPTTDRAVKVRRKVQSCFTIDIVLKNPKIEFMEMIKSEVATAFFILTPRSITKAGTIKKPPPAPIKPVIIPTKSPCEIRIV